MRIKLLLLAIIIVFTLQKVDAQTPSYIPANGLIAYYPFNGNANDASGNGNNGIVNGATLTTDRFGNSSSAYNFNGTSTYINCGTSSNLINPSVFTYSVWINNIDNVSTATEQKFVISNYNGGLRGNLLISQNSSIGDFRIHDGTNQKDAFSNIVYNINNWYHLVAVKDNTTIKIYVNNTLAQVTDITNFNYLTNTNSPFTIGKAGWSNAGYFKGKIDDLIVWNRVLTKDEISNLYYSDNTCQSLVINTGVLSFNPVTYNNTVTIYPNPANDHITIDCGNIANVNGWTIKIINTLGQEVFNGAMNQQQYTVPLNTWSGQGVYFVKIYDNQGNEMNTKKIILQ